MPADLQPRPVRQIEIRVADLGRSIAFYAGAFGWKVIEVSADYAVIDTGRAPFVSLWAVGESGMPLGVGVYVTSRDCVADAERARLLGARIAVERTAVLGSGSFTLVLDPWGNELTFWQADTPSEPVAVHGRLSRVAWIEIGAADGRAAVAFYQQLIGWQFAPREEVVDYWTFDLPDLGVGLVGGERGAQLGGPTCYMAVASVNDFQAGLGGLGGRVLGAAVVLKNGSRFCLFADPDGNRLGAFGG